MVQIGRVARRNGQAMTRHAAQGNGKVLLSGVVPNTATVKFCVDLFRYSAVMLLVAGSGAGTDLIGEVKRWLCNV